MGRGGGRAPPAPSGAPSLAHSAMGPAVGRGAEAQVLASPGGGGGGGGGAPPPLRAPTKDGGGMPAGETERKGLMRGSEEGRGLRRGSAVLTPPSHQQALNCFPLGLEEPALPGEGPRARDTATEDRRTGGPALAELWRSLR